MVTEDRAIPLQKWLDHWNNLKLPDWKLYSGYGVNGAARVGRVVRLVDLAYQAETGGRLRHADFFWKEAHQSLRRAWSEGGEWVNVAREVFWETHWGFVRGGLLNKKSQDINADDRVFTHVGWIRQMAELLPVEAANMREDIEAVLLLKLDALARAEKLEEAAQTGKLLIELVPERPEYFSRTAELYLTIGFSKFKANSNNAVKQENVLRSAITELEVLRQKSRPNLAVLQTEAILRQTLGISLANSGQIADALVESRKAMALDPSVEGGEENFNKLVDLMNQRQQQMKAVQDTLSLGNRHLTTEGQRMLEDSRRGFSPVEEFLRSSEYEVLSNQYMDAVALLVWRSAGLMEPDENDPQPREFLKALTDILNNPPKTPEAIEKSWQGAAAKYPSLVSLSSKSVHGYLHRRLFPDDPGAPAPQHTGCVPKLSKGPIIEPAARPAARDGEPFRAWLYSRYDWRIKIQCAAAIVLLMIAVSVGVRDYFSRGTRAEAYAEARQAATLDDPEKVMDACAKFLQHRVLGNDSRQDEMVRLYDETLVNWMLRQNPEEDQLTRRLTERNSWRSSGGSDNA
jgi:tetratricopeptide (TPR) repeat protein